MVRRLGWLDRLEMQALSVFAREDGGNPIHRNGNLVRDAAETRRKLDPVVVELEISRRAGADVQDDLAILDEARRDAGTAIHGNQELRRET